MLVLVLRLATRTHPRGSGMQHLLWLPRVVAVCASGDAGAGRGGGQGAQLLLFPRFHLDSSSLLARYALAQARPTAL